MESVMAGSSSTTRMVRGSGSRRAPPAPLAADCRAGVDEWLGARRNVVGSAVSMSSSMHVTTSGEGRSSPLKQGLNPLRNAARPAILGHEYPFRDCANQNRLRRQKRINPWDASRKGLHRRVSTTIDLVTAGDARAVWLQQPCLNADDIAGKGSTQELDFVSPGDEYSAKDPGGFDGKPQMRGMFDCRLLHVVQVDRIVDMAQQVGLVKARLHGNLELGWGLPAHCLAIAAHARAGSWTAKRVGRIKSGWPLSISRSKMRRRMATVEA